MQTTCSTETTRTHCPKIAPFPATRKCEQQGHGLAEAGKVEPLPLIDRCREPSALATGQALRLPHGRSIQDFLGGPAFLVVWGALWSLLIFAYQSPLEDVALDESGEYSVAVPISPRSAPYQLTNWDAQIQAIGDSASLDDPTPSCWSGIVELDGRCVLGEEIEVTPPAEWRRH